MYFWEDDSGVVHTVTQAEGGEQGDPLMLALFSLDQHPALEAISHRVATVQPILQEELLHHSAIRVHHGKTHLWNKGGVEPTEVEALTAAARVSDPTAIVWRGDPALPPSEQGVRILGTPLGHPEFVRAELGRLWNMTI